MKKISDDININDLSQTILSKLTDVDYKLLQDIIQNRSSVVDREKYIVHTSTGQDYIGVAAENNNVVFPLRAPEDEKSRVVIMKVIPKERFALNDVEGKQPPVYSDAILKDLIPEEIKVQTSSIMLFLSKLDFGFYDSNFETIINNNTTGYQKVDAAIERLGDAISHLFGADESSFVSEVDFDVLKVCDSKLALDALVSAVNTSNKPVNEYDFNIYNRFINIMITNSLYTIIHCGLNNEQIDTYSHIKNEIYHLILSYNAIEHTNEAVTYLELVNKMFIDTKI